MNSDSTPTSTPAATPNSFSVFGLSAPLLKAMDEMGFTSPTPIQEKAIPMLLGPSQDFIGLASTGTGKTGAFGIPLIEKIDANLKSTQGLVLSPTRELAMQVSEQLQKLGKYKGIRVITIYGGSSYRTQIDGVKRGAHIIVATPGRLVDFLEQKIIQLKDVQTLILDEADEMISMGFKDDLEFILKQTHSDEASSSNRAACRTWLFSATMSKDIRRVADQYLDKPETIEVAKVHGATDLTKQIYYTVKDEHKNEVISRLLQIHDDFHGIIFCQTKMEVIELEDKLKKRGYAAASLHGDKQQKEREVTLRQFRSGEVRILVATDVAARGLDVKDLTHVVNHSLPWDVESYVHRIGRTGRNGKEGIAISLINPRQVSSLRRLQNVTRKTLEKAKIPSADEVAQIRLNKFMALLSGVAVESRKYQVALGIFQELVAKDETGSLNAGTAPELLARVITALHPEMLAEKDYDLDFLRGAPLETRNPRGDRDGYSLSGGSRNYDRGSDRGGSRGGYDRGGDRGGSRGGYDRAPVRERFEPSAERRSAATPRFADRDASFSRDSRPSAAAPVKFERGSGRPAAPRAQYGASSPSSNESAAPAPAKKKDYYVKKADRPGYVPSENSEDNLPKRDRGPRFDGFDFGDGSTRFSNKDERKPRAASATAARAVPVDDKRPGGSRPPLRKASDHPGITRQRPGGAPKRRFRNME